MNSEKDDIRNGYNLDLRSEEVQEILGRPPRWIVRAGITVIFVVVAGLFVGSYFIKYPDVLTATITVTTENLPASVMAKATGKIDSVLVTEKDTVAQGAVLAVIDNPADWQDVMRLNQMLAMEQQNNDSVVDTFYATPPLQLGDLQPAYIAYAKAANDYRHFIETDYHNRKIRGIRNQIATQKKLLQKTQNQLQLSRKQLETAQKLFEMDSSLYHKKTLSLAEYETAKSTYLQQLQSYESARMSLDNQQMSILQSEQSVFDLEQQRIEEENSLRTALNGAREQLLAQIRIWEQTYLLTAPCDGVATFTKYWQKNQNIGAGEVMVTVVPQGEAKIIGKILLPPQGAGKVKSGQTVNVKFDDYPFMEYGMVRVTIQNISLVPVQVGEENKAYMLEVAFPDKLVTTYRKELAFSQEMGGTAEIITEDLRLLDKFINPIKAVIKK